MIKNLILHIVVVLLIFYLAPNLIFYITILRAPFEPTSVGLLCGAIYLLFVLVARTSKYKLKIHKDGDGEQS